MIMTMEQQDMFAGYQPVPKVQKPVVLATPKHEDPSPQNNPDKRDLRKETEAWIQANPDVAKLFLHFARELASKQRHFGIGLITERVRYEQEISTSPGKFKVNNNWRSYIARWLIAQDPGLEKWMSFREVRY
jgi:hypothetical protein